MIVDTSALLAILFGEPEADTFTVLISAAPAPRMSAASYIEAALQMDGLGVPALANQLDALIDRLGLVLAPVTLDQARSAREAGRRFGKGRHPAALNFGDCFSYALAKSAGEPLLFKGDDFSRTDIVAATIAPS